MAIASQLESPFAEAGQSEVEVLLRSSEAVAGDVGKLPSAQCPICMEELVADDGVTTVLPGCSHAFHSSCIREWLNRAPTPTCPSCRRGMTKQRAYMNDLAAIESYRKMVREEPSVHRERRADPLGVRTRRERMFQFDPDI